MPPRARSLRRRAGVVAFVLPVLVAGPVSAASADPQPAAHTVVGTIVRAYVEHRDQSDADASSDFGAPVTYVDPGSGPAVRVPTAALAGVPVGATVAVTVRGTFADAPAIQDHLAPAQQVSSAVVVAPAPATPVTPTDTVSIAMVVPARATADTTPLSAVVDQVAGPVASFWASQSDGRVQIGVADTHDLRATPLAEDCSDPEALWDDVAAQIGWTPGAGKHLLVHVPGNAPGCSYGLAEISGERLYVTAAQTSVIAHELGHNLGLLHSGSEECDGAVETGSCQTQEYGDYYDVMGASWSQTGSLNAVQSARLGFLPGGQVQSVPATGPGGTFNLAPLSGTSGTRAVRLTTATGTTYYLEYRTASGQDSWLGDPYADWTGLGSGVLLHRVEQTNAADSSMLLDGTPSAGAGYGSDHDPVLPVGTTIPVAGGRFFVVVGSEGPSGASVSVKPGAASGTWTTAANRPPVGSVDVVGASGGSLRVAGWALDPDEPSVPSQVHVYVDGAGTAEVAEQSRPDVGAAFPEAGAGHGFDWSTPVTPGVHTVCLYAIDAQLAGTHTDLGCRNVQVAAGSPLGSWDTADGSGGSVSVSGWAFDPDSPTAASQVHVYVDGVGTALVAEVLRPDVGAAYPNAGAAHGFTWSTRAAPGAHTVCTYAIDVQLPGQNTGLGCRTVTVGSDLPVASWDVLQVGGTALRVSGWAFDPDSPQVASQVHVYVDGVGTALMADRSRPDVGAVFPDAGEAHGYDWSASVAPGAHTVCLYAIDVQQPSRNLGLGCRTATAAPAA